MTSPLDPLILKSPEIASAIFHHISYGTARVDNGLCNANSASLMGYGVRRAPFDVGLTGFGAFTSEFAFLAFQFFDNLVELC